MEADGKGKVLKIVKLVISIYILVELFWLVVACILFIRIFLGGTADYDELVERFIAKHGREPNDDFELYHDF